ncbi:MAG: type II secretion system protein [Phycisphaerales bacterium JB043]
MIRTHTRTTPRAFTLIELIVVITIIALLMGLVIGTGAQLVIDQQRARTERILVALDRALEEYMAENNNRPPIVRLTDFANTPGLDLNFEDGEVDILGEHPLDQAIGNRAPRASFRTGSDAYLRYDPNDEIYPRYPDASVFIEAVQGYGVVDAILADLGDRLIPTPSDGPTGSSSATASSVTPSVVDSWYDNDWETTGERWPVFVGMPILYITPNNAMAQFLYGQTVNRRPYFMSAGPDRLYGTTNEFGSGSSQDSAFSEEAIEALADNMYSYDVGAPNLSDAFTVEYR